MVHISYGYRPSKSLLAGIDRTRLVPPALPLRQTFPLLGVLVRIESHVTEKCDTLLWRMDEEETLNVY